MGMVKRFIIYIALLWFILGTWLIVHEETHKEIYRLHNVESETKYGFMLLSGLTSPTNSTGIVYKEEMALGHDLTEAIGYQLKPVIMVLGIILCVLIEMMIINIVAHKSHGD